MRCQLPQDLKLEAFINLFIAYHFYSMHSRMVYPVACVACDAVHEYMKVIEGTKCKEKNRTAYDPTLSCSSHFTKERTFHSKDFEL